jgi:thioredoxin 1
MMMNGAMDEIAAEFVDRLKVGRVKLDRSPNLGLWYGIRCLPTILYFSDGEVCVGIVGTTSKEAILSQLKPVSARGARLSSTSIGSTKTDTQCGSFV